MKLRKIINFTKKPRKKLEIKIIRTKLKTRIPSIWKPLKFLQKGQYQKLKIKRIRIKIEIPKTKRKNL